MKKFLYGNILQTSTLQFDGHIRDHFVENSKRVVAFYILPRGGSLKNFIEIYEKGKIRKKIDLFSPTNIFLAYVTYYIQYLHILFFIFPRGEKIYFINYLPIFFFFNSIVRLFKNIEIIYWVADYWPMEKLSIKIFRFLMHYYHDNSKNTLYMSDRINKAMNRKVMRLSNKKTVGLGIKHPKVYSSKKLGYVMNLCFIGVIVDLQGIDLLLRVVSNNKQIKLKLIGTGRQALISKYEKLIKKYDIKDRVYFPKKFFYGKELFSQIKDCHVGIALYKEDKNSATYYADPAKIKQYAEFGLPIIITNAADVASYIKRFHAGVVVERNIESVGKAITEIKNNYSFYMEGLNKFNEHFNYKKYYRRAFRFLEDSR